MSGVDITKIETHLLISLSIHFSSLSLTYSLQAKPGFGVDVAKKDRR